MIDNIIYVKIKPYTMGILMSGQGYPDIKNEAYHLVIDLYWQKPLSHDLFKKVAKNGVPGFGINEQNV